MRATKLAIPLFAAGLFFSASAHDVQAQSYAETVWTQLQHVYSAVNENDYRLENYIIGRLDDSATDSWSFQLSAGTTYMVIGACDEDCSDLDIAVRDEAGDVVAQDNLDDDAPVVTFTPSRSGRFSIRTSMYECNASYCYFGFGLFKR